MGFQEMGMQECHQKIMEFEPPRDSYAHLEAVFCRKLA
jgi:hypothetical protein